MVRIEIKRESLEERRQKLESRKKELESEVAYLRAEKELVEEEAKLKKTIEELKPPHKSRVKGFLLKSKALADYLKEFAASRRAEEERATLRRKVI
jgi:hypothetical protein